MWEASGIRLCLPDREPLCIWVKNAKKAQYKGISLILTQLKWQPIIHLDL